MNTYYNIIFRQYKKKFPILLLSEKTHTPNICKEGTKIIDSLTTMMKTMEDMKYLSNTNNNYSIETTMLIMMIKRMKKKNSASLT